MGDPRQEASPAVPIGKSVELPTSPPALWYLGYRIGQNDRPHLRKISPWLRTDRETCTNRCKDSNMIALPTLAPSTRCLFGSLSQASGPSSQTGAWLEWLSQARLGGRGGEAGHREGPLSHWREGLASWPPFKSYSPQPHCLHPLTLAPCCPSSPLSGKSSRGGLCRAPRSPDSTIRVPLPKLPPPRHPTLAHPTPPPFTHFQSLKDIGAALCAQTRKLESQRTGPRSPSWSWLNLETQTSWVPIPRFSHHMPRGAASEADWAELWAAGSVVQERPRQSLQSPG